MAASMAAAASTSVLNSPAFTALAARTAAVSAARTTGGTKRGKLSLVDEFLAREVRLKERIARSPGGAATLTSLAGGVNPQATTMYKHPRTGRWIPPRLSLRRQAVLGKTAYREGRFDELLDAFKTLDLKLGAKLNKLRLRIAEGETVKARAAETANVPLQAIQAVQRGETVSPEEAKRQAVKLAMSFARTQNPYRGRSPRNVFKGTIAERSAPARKRAIVEKLGKMDATIATWRQTRQDAKIKAQPKLPF